MVALGFRIRASLFRGRLGRVWWYVLLRGIASVLFSALAFASPRNAALTLVALFGAYALVDGVVTLFASARGGDLPTRRWLAMAAAASILAGLFAFLRPTHTALVLILTIGLWLIARGLTEIVGAAVAARQERRREWALALGGVMSVLFGIGVIAYPRLSALSLVWALGLWAFVNGALMIVFAFRLRRLVRDRAPEATAASWPG